MKEKDWHRRHALQIACALPEDSDDALIVLRMATQLVARFLHEEPPKKQAPVVALIGGNDCA